MSDVREIIERVLDEKTFDEGGRGISDAILQALADTGYCIVPAETGGMLEGLEIAEAWLRRWAAHVGSCKGGDECTCGLTRVRFDVASAIAAAQEGDSNG